MEISCLIWPYKDNSILEGTQKSTNKKTSQIPPRVGRLQKNWSQNTKEKDLYDKSPYEIISRYLCTVIQKRTIKYIGILDSKIWNACTMGLVWACNSIV